MPPGCAQGALKNFKIPEVRPFTILRSRLKIWSHASKSQKTVSNPGFWAENPILERFPQNSRPDFPSAPFYTSVWENFGANQDASIRSRSCDRSLKPEHDTTCAPRSRDRAPNFNARARKNLFYLSFLNVREARPPSSGRPGRARARARALSTKQNLKITTFLLVNFENDQGKSCSVSRDWQPPKISAQSVPIL